MFAVQQGLGLTVGFKGRVLGEDEGRGWFEAGKRDITHGFIYKQTAKQKAEKQGQGVRAGLHDYAGCRRIAEASNWSIHNPALQMCVVVCFLYSETDHARL
eukprot:TRINITY_DN24920_c0_g1_i1.p1 TRINITY_DN24920_c0_g1~~TRINITY_DN24920_c0_g1_i1.p1  ORF type:complete len:101 (+),score=7.06 TRINITY_DN24920_c0_g1_i1:188-490(+)